MCCFSLFLLALSFFAVPSIGYAVDKMCRQALTLRTRQIALSYRLANKKTTLANQSYLYLLPAVLYPLLGEQRFYYPCKRVFWVVPTPIGSKERCASYLRLYGSTALRLYGSTALRLYGSTALRLYGSTALRLYGSTALRLYGSTALSKSNDSLIKDRTQLVLSSNSTLRPLFAAYP